MSPSVTTGRDRPAQLIGRELLTRVFVTRTHFQGLEEASRHHCRLQWKVHAAGFVVAVVPALPQRVGAVSNQSSGGVASGGCALQRVGVREEPAFD